MKTPHVQISCIQLECITLITTSKYTSKGDASCKKGTLDICIQCSSGLACASSLSDVRAIYIHCLLVRTCYLESSSTDSRRSQIRLRGCADWSGATLFVYGISPRRINKSPCIITNWCLNGWFKLVYFILIESNRKRAV